MPKYITHCLYQDRFLDFRWCWPTQRGVSPRCRGHAGLALPGPAGVKQRFFTPVLPRQNLAVATVDPARVGILMMGPLNQRCGTLKVPHHGKGRGVAGQPTGAQVCVIGVELRSRHEVFQFRKQPRLGAHPAAEVAHRGMLRGHRLRLPEQRPSDAHTAQPRRQPAREYQLLRRHALRHTRRAPVRLGQPVGIHKARGFVKVTHLPRQLPEFCHACPLMPAAMIRISWASKHPAERRSKRPELQVLPALAIVPGPC